MASDGSLDQAIYNLLVKLQTGSSTLLDHIDKRGWCGTLITDALAYSRTDGFLWCLVLEDVLQEFERLDLQYDSTLLLTEVQSLASLEEKECQTLNTLLNHLDGIYELKVITEQFAALLSQENDERGRPSSGLSFFTDMIESGGKECGDKPFSLGLVVIAASRYNVAVAFFS